MTGNWGCLGELPRICPAIDPNLLFRISSLYRHTLLPMPSATPHNLVDAHEQQYTYGSKGHGQAALKLSE